ncbi:hypothetical protein SERLA73DRAFT_70037 [Serpula lacrymans var. lacrymans S7.3]|uniref:Uncharacterized protein n=2 Tax=Serpula lacrymans var. lacrymans TaxID=341189 RepID=F8PLQ0_SERL3|nr:uncharacterized protein SERLADRAFT_434145 [Serpula lacrymans var. lacrymans S7.9]EGO02532.1 hypothetical protein SERLA73DRAFT_70037 [Serpula lacrymans var. lacrymans S7.3]EGO28255.1 hypothetical protein SERLADRAFT_434145 [Serpula lacrymans var. lacrymans S7.9]
MARVKASIAAALKEQKNRYMRREGQEKIRFEELLSQSIAQAKAKKTAQQGDWKKEMAAQYSEAWQEKEETNRKEAEARAEQRMETEKACEMAALMQKLENTAKENETPLEEQYYQCHYVVEELHKNSDSQPQHQPYPPHKFNHLVPARMSKSTGQYFVHLDNTLQVFTSPNADSLSYIPSEEDVLRFSMHPCQTLVPRWASGTYSYTGYTPIKIKLTGPLLSCLILPSKIPIEKIDGQCFLTKNFCASWLRFEDGLSQAATANSLAP